MGEGDLSQIYLKVAAYEDLWGSFSAKYIFWFNIYQNKLLQYNNADIHSNLSYEN